MTLRRIIPILAAALLVMTAVVVLRGETSRRNSELLSLEQDERLVLQELKEKELELARLQNPGLIRETLIGDRDAKSNHKP